MSVAPGLTRLGLAVEGASETVRCPGVAGVLDDNGSDFFFEAFAHNELKLVMHPEGEYEISVIAPAVLADEFFIDFADPALAEDAAA